VWRNFFYLLVLSKYPSIPIYSSFDLILWVLRRQKRFKVVGPSMLPTLKPGDEVFVNLRAYRKQLPQVGDVVLVQHPEQPNIKILKRITAVSPQNHLFLEGDNPTESNDSRHFGWVPLERVYGRVNSLFL